MDIQTAWQSHKLLSFFSFLRTESSIKIILKLSVFDDSQNQEL